MPVISSMELQRPKNWQDFERIVHASQSERWASPRLQMNGRPGQKQNGVDIYGPDDLERPVAIQCKRYKSALTLKVIAAEIQAAETFKDEVSALYFATTLDHDAKLQRQMRKMSADRVAKGKFALSVLFWDDIVYGLALKPAVFRNFYPQITLPQAVEVDSDKAVAALTLGFYGGYFWDYIELICGEFGVMANADRDEVRLIARIIEVNVPKVFAAVDAKPLLDATRLTLEAVFPKKGTADWDTAKYYGLRIETWVNQSPKILATAQGRLSKLGGQLGHIFHNVDNGLSADALKKLKTQIEEAIPITDRTALGKMIEKIGEARTPSNHIHSILNFLSSQLQVASMLR